MAFTGSNNILEVGLRLLLSPPGSNIIVRTACAHRRKRRVRITLYTQGVTPTNLLWVYDCSVGVVVPVYNTFKAIERKDPDEQHKCLVYWAAYGSFTVAEMITDKLIYWFPLYYHMKFAFLVWLQLPPSDGATQLYMNHMRPFLLRHQAKLDHIVGLIYSEMAKFAAVHQAELQFVKKILGSIVDLAMQALGGILHPAHGRRRGSAGNNSNGGGYAAIEGPEEEEEDPEHED